MRPTPRHTNSPSPRHKASALQSNLNPTKNYLCSNAYFLFSGNFIFHRSTRIVTTQKTKDSKEILKQGLKDGHIKALRVILNKGSTEDHVKAMRVILNKGSTEDHFKAMRVILNKGQIEVPVKA